MNINLFIRCDLTVLCGLLLVFFLGLCASSSHWIVTDGGLKINALPDSPYHMEQPHSLVDFLEQEKIIDAYYKRADIMQQLRDTVKNGIYEDDPDLEEKFRKHDSDCRTSAKFPFNTDNFASSYAVDIYHLMGQSPKLSLTFDAAHAGMSPLCALPEYYKSDHFKQNLRCFESRRNVELKPEFELRDILPEHQEFKDLDGALYHAMDEYPRDAVLAYYAMLFWRVRGNATNAADCLLRHMYLSQLESSDVTAAGFALGNLLVKLGCYNESIPYLLNTVSAFPDNPDIRSAYADALALSGNHSPALEIYSDVFRRHPSRVVCAMKAAALRCHIKLIAELEKQHKNLVDLVSLAHRYSDRFDFVESLNPEVKAKLASWDKRFQSSLLYDHFTYGTFKQLKCPATTVFSKEEGKSQDRLVCTLKDPSAYSKDLIRRHVERVTAIRAKNARNEEKERKPKEWWDEEASSSHNVQEVVAFFKALEPFVGMNIDEPSYPKKYPLEAPKPHSMFPWPNRTVCDRQKRRGIKAPSKDALPQLFMSVDNKGFVTSDFFTKYLRLLSENDVHPLPWNQPSCDVNAAELNARIPEEAREGVRIALETQRKRARFVETNVLQSFLALSGSEMRLSTGDIGQRITTLRQMEIAPDWMTSNWAALYWRVNGAPNKAVECLLRALSQEDGRYDDVALVQLAQLILATAPNNTQDALALLERALTVDDSEPLTHYLIGVIEFFHKRPSTAYRRFIEALKRDPDFLPAQEALVSSRCAALMPPVKVSDRIPPECCSPAESTVYCVRSKKRRVCYKIEFGSDYKASFVYHRCGEEYLGRSDAVPGVFHIQMPFIFSTDDKRREDLLLAHRRKASSAIEQNADSAVEDDELPLDYRVKDSSRYFENRAPQYPVRPREVRFNPDAYVPPTSTLPLNAGEDAVEEEWFEEVVLAESEADTNKLTFDDISDIRKVLALDVPMPEVLAEPPMEMVKKGAFYFKPPTANTFHDFCAIYKKGSVFLDQPPSTWVSVTAKGVDYEDHIDFTTPVAGHGQYEPECPDLDSPSAVESFDHLPPYHVRDRLKKFYKPEKALTDALKSMAHEMERIEHVAARLHIAMRVSRLQPGNENQAGGVHWTLTTASTLYWRVKGDVMNAIKCLRHSLNNAPPDMRDIALVSMANIYQNTGFLHSALISASAAYRISPHLVVSHATLANIYAALADYERALKFYYSTLAIQSNFKPAKERIRAIYCQTGMTYNLFPGIKH